MALRVGDRLIAPRTTAPLAWHAGLAAARAGPLSDRGARLLADAMYRYLRWVARRSEVVADDSVPTSPLDEMIGSRAVFYYWNRDAFSLLLRECRAQGSLGRGVAVLRDESFGAEVTAWLLTFVGRETRPLRWRDPISRAADLREVIRRREPVAFAVDGHGPYGRVGPGFPRLLERMGAAAVPVAARVSRKIPVRLRATFDVPLPGTRLAVLVGKPVHPETAGPALLETLQASLDALGHEAERALRSSALT